MTSVPNIPNPNNAKAIQVIDLEGGQVYDMPVSITTNNAVDTGDLLAVGGLQLTTSGVSDSTNKRFVTDAELANLVTLGPLVAIETELLALGSLTGAETKLSTTAAVNLNQDPETNLYTVPSGKSCLITRVIIRLASTSLTTASIAFGFNAATDNDVIATATHTELTGNTLFTILIPKTGAKVGTSTGVFSAICTIKQGGAATCTIDTFGILF